jgi:hypothetical protein
MSYDLLKLERLTIKMQKGILNFNLYKKLLFIL